MVLIVFMIISMIGWTAMKRIWRARKREDLDELELLLGDEDPFGAP